MTAPLSVAERVAAGISWLDANRPGWERRIDLDTLDMSDCCGCVLGQVWRDEATDADADADVGGYGYVRDHLITARGDVVALGFHRPAGVRWLDLTDAWRDAIKARFDSGLLSDSGEGAQ